MTKLSTPDITPAQILGALTFGVTEAVALGVLSAGTGQIIVQVAGIVLPGVLMLADFAIRHGRAKISVALIEQETAQLIKMFEHAPPTPPTP